MTTTVRPRAVSYDRSTIVLSTRDERKGGQILEGTLARFQDVPTASCRLNLSFLSGRPEYLAERNVLSYIPCSHRRIRALIVVDEKGENNGPFPPPPPPRESSERGPGRVSLLSVQVRWRIVEETVAPTAISLSLFRESRVSINRCRSSSRFVFADPNTVLQTS